MTPIISSSSAPPQTLYVYNLKIKESLDEDYICILKQNPLLLLRHVNSPGTREDKILAVLMDWEIDRREARPIANFLHQQLNSQATAVCCCVFFLTSSNIKNIPLHSPLIFHCFLLSSFLQPSRYQDTKGISLPPLGGNRS
jgi:hypothetical protein